MTSTWNLLYFWKPRAGRSQSPAGADPQQENSSRGESGHRRPRHRHGDGSRYHHRDDPNPSHHPLPRSHSAQQQQQQQLLHARNLCHRASLPDHEQVQLDGRSSDSTETSIQNYDRVVSRVRLIRNNQLPDTVIQARERLVERLRGVSLAESREPTASRRDESAAGHDLQTYGDWFSSDLEHADITLNNSKKKPFGVRWEALYTLHFECFKNSEELADVRAAVECSICLESFCDGDGLIRLHCGHRFHPMCLQPWVRSCSDCPYCRANITPLEVS